MINFRPRNCPDPTCTPIFSPDPGEGRLCFGRLAREKWVNHDGLWDTINRCDEDSTVAMNAPDLFDEAKGCILGLKEIMKSGLPNVCGEQAIADPLEELKRLLQE